MLLFRKAVLNVRMYLKGCRNQQFDFSLKGCCSERSICQFYIIVNSQVQNDLMLTKKPDLQAAKGLTYSWKSRLSGKAQLFGKRCTNEWNPQ